MIITKNKTKTKTKKQQQQQQQQQNKTKTKQTSKQNKTKTKQKEQTNKQKTLKWIMNLVELYKFYNHIKFYKLPWSCRLSLYVHDIWKLEGIWKSLTVDRFKVNHQLK